MLALKQTCHKSKQYAQNCKDNLVFLCKWLLFLGYRLIFNKNEDLVLLMISQFAANLNSTNTSFKRFIIGIGPSQGVILIKRKAELVSQSRLLN
ncbi:MAG: hypothetical protein DWQ48_08000 [Bacteroidetes bacterium]|nr:MAG: hypothetical protein DWQ48_08000 [Bacteroidota bacterium]